MISIVFAVLLNSSAFAAVQLDSIEATITSFSDSKITVQIGNQKINFDRAKLGDAAKNIKVGDKVDIAITKKTTGDSVKK